MRLTRLLPAVMGGGASLLPYSLDFSTQPDGALPSPLVANASTWAISSGVAVCTPATYGSELLTDPGLEGTYTGGLNANLTETGSGTPAEETVDVHGGSKAQKITWGALYDSLNRILTTTAHQYLLMSAWCKKASGSGTSVIFFSTDSDSLGRVRHSVSGDWTQYFGTLLSKTTTRIFLQCATAGDVGAELLIDDQSIKPMTTGEIIAMLPATRSDVAVKASYNTTAPQHNYLHGVIARADSLTNPQSYLLAAMRNSDGNARLNLYKVVSGVLTYLTGAYVGLTGQRLIEIRTSGSTVQLFYNGVQQGTDQTVSDAEILSNKIHGFISTGGGNSLNSFFVT